MELLLVLFLIALSDKDARMKQALREALDFYRENRELIAMLAGKGQSTGPAPSAAQDLGPAPSDPAKPASDQKNEPCAPIGVQNKTSPEIGGDHLRLLEELLKKRGV